MKSSLKKNFALQIVYQVLTIIAPLITAPYISRVLGADNIGRYQYVYAKMIYFEIFAALGINNYGSRAIAQSQNNKEKMNSIFSEIMLLHTIVGVLVLIAYFAFVFLFVHEDVLLFYIQALFIIGIITDIGWFFAGIEDFQSIVLKKIIVKTVSIVLILFAVKEHDDIISYTLIMSASALADGVILFTGLKGKVSLVRVSLKNSLTHLRPLIVLFLPAIAVVVYKYMDKIMLGDMVSKTAVGYYNSGERIISLATSLINALGIVMLPRIASLVSNNDTEMIKNYFHKSMVLIGFLSFGCCTGAASVAEDFVPLFYGQGFEPAIKVTIILSLTLPFSALTNVVKTQYMLPNKKDRQFAIVVIVGAIINFVVNYNLIPIYGIMGATIGTLLTEGFVCVILVLCSNSAMNTIKEVFVSLGFGVISLIMIVMGKPFDRVDNELLRLCLKVFAEGITYLLLSMVYLLCIDKPLFIEYYNRIKRRNN